MLFFFYYATGFGALGFFENILENDFPIFSKNYLGDGIDFLGSGYFFSLSFSLVVSAALTTRINTMKSNRVYFGCIIND